MKVNFLLWTPLSLGDTETKLIALDVMVSYANVRETKRPTVTFLSKVTKNTMRMKISPKTSNTERLYRWRRTICKTIYSCALDMNQKCRTMETGSWTPNHYSLVEVKDFVGHLANFGKRIVKLKDEEVGVLCNRQNEKWKLQDV